MAPVFDWRWQKRIAGYDQLVASNQRDRSRVPKPPSFRAISRLAALGENLHQIFSASLLASRAVPHYINGAGLHGALGAHIPGALSIHKGAVPDRAPGPGHMAPTYLGREPGIERSDGRGGSALFSLTPAAHLLLPSP